MLFESLPQVESTAPAVGCGENFRALGLDGARVPMSLFSVTSEVGANGTSLPTGTDSAFDNDNDNDNDTDAATAAVDIRVQCVRRKLVSLVSPEADKPRGGLLPAHSGLWIGWVLR